MCPPIVGQIGALIEICMVSTSPEKRTTFITLTKSEYYKYLTSYFVI